MEEVDEHSHQRVQQKHPHAVADAAKLMNMLPTSSEEAAGGTKEGPRALFQLQLQTPVVTTAFGEDSPNSSKLELQLTASFTLHADDVFLLSLTEDTLHFEKRLFNDMVEGRFIS